MAENLDTAAVSQLIAGDTHEMKPAVIASGAGVLTRGTVLGMLTASHEFTQLNPAGADGSEVARAILVEDVDATSAAADALVYGLGKFRLSDLVWPDGISDADKNTALLNLADRGILVDKNFV